MSREHPPDVEIGAAVTADELRLSRRAEVEIHADEVSSRRERLPRPARAGIDYRHVAAAMRAASRLRTQRGRSGGS